MTFRVTVVSIDFPVSQDGTLSGLPSVGGPYLPPEVSFGYCQESRTVVTTSKCVRNIRLGSEIFIT